MHDDGYLPLLELIDLSKVYQVTRGLTMKTRRVPALTGIDLRIFPGETLGIVGESGCGNQRWVAVIVKLDRPTSGIIKFMGNDITQLRREYLKAYRRQVQIVFQDPLSALNPRKPIGSILEEPLTIHGWDSKMKRRQRVEEILRQVGLEEAYRNRFPHELSGGQRQRVVIARALVIAPQVIVADEPVSALDVSIQAQILNLLKDLQEIHHLTYLFISHDLNVVRFMSDRMAVMYGGRIMELGPAEKIYGEPRHPYTKALIAAIPLFKMRKHVTPMIMGEGDITAPPLAGCPFYPRCPEQCPPGANAIPSLKETAPGYLVACHLVS